nr:NEAT domain-containing protein [Streptococcus loxodontisalivarius]
MAGQVQADTLSDLNTQKANLTQQIQEAQTASTSKTASVGVTILKEDQSGTSMMQQYIVSPASVTREANGSYTVLLTILHPEYWQEFKVNGADVTLVSDNQVSFTVSDITALQTCYVHVAAPALNYEGKYTTYMSFDSTAAASLAQSSSTANLDELNKQLEEVNQKIADETAKASTTTTTSTTSSSQETTTKATTESTTKSSKESTSESKASSNQGMVWILSLIIAFLGLSGLAYWWKKRS